MTIYLSGAITNRKNYKKEFFDAKEKIQKYLKEKKQKAKIIIPFEGEPKNKEWEDYLKRDIKILMDCDLLIDIENGSNTSKGVLTEKIVCTCVNIPIITLTEFLKNDKNGES